MRPPRSNGPRAWRHMYVGFPAFRGRIVLTSAPAPKELPGRREVEKLSDETLFWRLVHETYFFRCLRPSLLIRPVCIAGNLCLAFYPLRNDPLFGGMSTCRGREREGGGTEAKEREGGTPRARIYWSTRGTPRFCVIKMQMCGKNGLQRANRRPPRARPGRPY